MIKFFSCQSAPWNINSVSNMITSVLVSPPLTPQPFAPSSVVFALPCGSVSYSLSPTSSLVILDSVLQTISVVSSNSADVGGYPMNLIAKLDSYPLNTQTMSFLVTISSWSLQVQQSLRMHLIPYKQSSFTFVILLGC